MICKTRRNVSCLLTEAVESSTPTLAHVVPSTGRGECVTAVTSLGDHVFILRWAIQQVLVYDARTFKLQRRISIPSLCCLWGLAACAHYKCLYVSDGVCKSVIHRVELPDDTTLTKWSVADSPRGLSVNMEHNVVVASYEMNKIEEYTTHGSLVREITLQAGVRSPFHAVQLSSGHFAVSQFTSPGAVSVVGADGQAVRCCRPSQTSAVGKMLYPRSLAVTKNDDILVADRDNDRIISISSSLRSAQVLHLPVDSGIQVPWGLCLDESRGRVYVGEGGGSFRVLVFDGVRL